MYIFCDIHPVKYSVIYVVFFMGDVQRAELQPESAALECISKQGDSGRVMNLK